MATINTQALTAYIDQLSGELIRESVLLGRTAKLIDIQTGIKHSEAINILTSNYTLAAGGCGVPSPVNNSRTLTQRNITVYPVKIDLAECFETDVEPYWMNQMMKAGSYNTDGPVKIEALYAADLVDKVDKLVEENMWLGDPNSTYGAYNLVGNGFLSILEQTSASASVVTITGYTGSVTTNNIIGIVDAMSDAIPNDITNAKDLSLYLSYPQYKTYCRALRILNNYHFDGDQNDFMTVHPGTNIKVVATGGLNPTSAGNKMLLTTDNNLVLGTDLQSDYEKFNVWFEPYTDTLYTKVKFKIGMQIKHPQYCVLYKG